MAATREAQRRSPGATDTSEALYKKLSPGPGKSASEVAAHQRARLHSAMVKLVADRGYSAVTVREVARLAGVSSRAFYKLFEGKEECFLRTYDLVVRHAVKRIVAAQAGEYDQDRRLQLALQAFTREIAREPRAARFVLVEAYLAGPDILRRARQTESMIADGIARLLQGQGKTPLALEWVVGGAIGVVRASLNSGDRGGVGQIGIALGNLTSGFKGEVLEDLARLDQLTVSRRQKATAVTTATQATGTPDLPDERSLLLAAVNKTVVRGGPGKLTVSSILTTAGLPRRSFNAHFDGIDDCIFAAIERRVCEAVERASAVAAGGDSPIDIAFQALNVFCTDIAEDQLFLRASFADVLMPGERGLECEERMISRLADLLGDVAPSAYGDDPIATMVSAAGIWGVVQRCLFRSANQRLRQPAILVAVACAYLASPRSVTAAVQDELASHEDPNGALFRVLVPDDRKRRTRKLDASPTTRDGHAAWLSHAAQTVTHSERNT